MKVLKFGGTSVATAENIQKVLSILKTASKKEPVVAVVSALGGVTDSLQQLGELANAKDSVYKEKYQSLVARHLDTASELGLTENSTKKLQELLSQLEHILQGIYLINEFSDKTKDKVLDTYFSEI